MANSKSEDYDSIRSLFADLSNEQQEAVGSPARITCILAGAGSGKTRVLVYRIAKDLLSGISPAGIIAFTFTEKAAEELRARVHLLIRRFLPNMDLSPMFVGTIHSWCLQYLLDQNEFYNFEPLDELHVDALVTRLYDFLELQKVYGKAFPKAAEDFQADLEVFYNEHLLIAEVPKPIRSALDRFLGVLKENRLITFGGMVRWATAHLTEHGALSSLQALYVDEYQDVNPAQVALIRAMLSEPAKLTVVGDELQCIYQWRGSDVRRILNCRGDFGESTVERLSDNYRSRPSLVTLSNFVADMIAFRDPQKVMRPKRSKGVEPAVHWLSLDSEEAQAETVAEVVGKLIEGGTNPRDIVILLRSVLGAGWPIVAALQDADLPVYCPILSKGGLFIDSFLIPIFTWLKRERKEPKNEQEEADLEAEADGLWRLVRDWLPNSVSESTFWRLLDQWEVSIEKQKNEAYNIRGQLYDFLEQCGIAISPTDYDLMVGMGIASQIIRSVEEIHRRRLKGQVRRTPRGVLSEICFALKRNKEDFGESVPIHTPPDSVLVTTVHQAKGLEWPIVIIPTIVNRRFPVASRRHKSSFPDNITARYGTNLEDETRLFYVAVTRAQEKLFLLDYDTQDRRKRSPFLQPLAKAGIEPQSNAANLPRTAWRVRRDASVYQNVHPVLLGLSDLLLYFDCPYQFGLRRWAGIQPSVGDELGFGRGLHELIQRQYDSDTVWSEEELQNQVHAHVHLPLMSEPEEERARQVIEKRLARLQDIGVFAAEVESEISVEVVFQGGVVHGIVDCICKTSTDGLLVRDWKTNVHETFIARYEKQLQFYVHALRAQGRAITAADVVDVGKTGESGSLSLHPVDISNDAIQKLINLCETGLAGIARAEFTPKPSVDACASCDVRRLCAERTDHAKTEQSERHLGAETRQF